MAMESMSHRHGIVLYSTLPTQSTTVGCIRKRQTLLSAVKTC
jgi:hypothetical protein